MIATRVVVLGALALLACTSSTRGSGGGEGDDGTSGGASGSNGNGNNDGNGNGYEEDGGQAASGPPPAITDISPRSGDYGTLVTITGDNLDAPGATITFDGPGEKLTWPMPKGTPSAKPDSVFKKWTKTEIVLRYPFPAEGAMRITTGAGEAASPKFAPSWRPGNPLSGVYSRRELLSVVSPSNGKLVALFDGNTGPKIVVAEADGTVTAKPFARGTEPVRAASLYVTSTGSVDGFFVSGNVVYQVTDAAGATTIASTGVGALFAAGNADDTGPYLWVKTGASTVTRLRPPSWADTGDSVTDPTPSSAPGHALAVGPDHSLYVGWGVNSTGFFPTFDHEAYPVARRLRSGQATFDAQRIIGEGADDYMIWTRLRAGPDGRVASYYCASDTGFLASTTLDYGEGYASAGAPLPSKALFDEYVVGWNATDGFATACELATAELRGGPEGQTAQHETIAFPCAHVSASAVDPAGHGVLVVWRGSYLYAPHKR